MYDIEELEEKWRRYRRKKLLRRFLWALLIVLLLALPLFYVEVYSEKEKTAVKKSRYASIGSEESISKQEVNVSRGQINEKLQKHTKASPLLQAVPPSMKEKKYSQVKSKRPKMQITFTDESHHVEDSTKKEGAVELSMVKRNDAAVIRSIEKRFPLSHNYDDAMYLAKYYYSKHRYKKAEYWAMQANVVDSTKAESWMLFAKAKAKGGHRTEAIRILQRYYDNTGDSQVKLLIDAMRKGRKF
ncbi:hypothetical protein [Nitratifractor sp.]